MESAFFFIVAALLSPQRHREQEFALIFNVSSVSGDTPTCAHSRPPCCSMSSTHSSLSFLRLLPCQHVDIAALLIKYNTCVNATDKWAFTPLHEAAQKGRTQLCALLLAHGADPTMKNQEGQTPLDLATVLPESSIKQTNNMWCCISNELLFFLVAG